METADIVCGFFAFTEFVYLVFVHNLMEITKYTLPLCGGSSSALPVHELKD